jgi:VWFA-related protein
MPQEIRHFSLEKLTAVAPADAGRPLLRKVPTAELTPQSRRTFLILMGRGMYQTLWKDVDALIRFVQKELLPQDLVAVFAYNRASDFTTDHEKIAAVLERYKKIHGKIESRLRLRFSRLVAIYGNKAMPKSLQPDIDSIFDFTGAPGSRQVPPGRVTGAGQMTRDTRDTSATMLRIEAAELTGIPVNPFDQLEVDSLTDLSFEDFVSTSAMTFQDTQNIYTSIEYLRYMDGEKHLLLFSQDGLFLPRMDYDRSIAAMANDARVAIDTFQTSGVFTTLAFSASQSIPPGGRAGRPAPPWSGTISRTFALSSLRTISELTGGRASIHEDIPKALSHVNEITRAQYLLGYYPTNEKWDGSYRKIAVRVNRPGVKVSFRRGYYARDQLQPFDREEFLSYSRIAAAAGCADDVNDLTFKISASGDRDESGQPQVWVNLSINPSGIRFETADGLHQGKVRVTLFYTDEHQRPLGDLWQTMDMKLREETWQKVLAEGIPYSVRLPLRAPSVYIKAVVYDPGNDRVGSRVIRYK